jgi:hypothetical protein
MPAIGAPFDDAGEPMGARPLNVRQAVFIYVGTIVFMAVVIAWEGYESTQLAMGSWFDQFLYWTLFSAITLLGVAMITMPLAAILLIPFLAIGYAVWRRFHPITPEEIEQFRQRQCAQRRPTAPPSDVWETVAGGVAYLLMTGMSLWPLVRWCYFSP